MKTNLQKLRAKLRKAMTERDQEIFQLRKSGETFESIGHKVGLTRQRVEQICRRMKDE